MAPLKITRDGDHLMVWDHIRKKNLVLTPEEWVRQHLLHYLQTQMKVPLSAIATESGIKLNQQLKRSDILVFKKAKPKLLVECKAPQVKIGQETFDQAARYNSVYQADYIMVSNGLQHYLAKVDHQNRKYLFIPDFPTFDQL